MFNSCEFVCSYRKQLCPSLVAIMGNPVNDKTIASHHGYTGALERERLSDRISLGNWIHERKDCGFVFIQQHEGCPVDPEQRQCLVMYISASSQR